MELVKAPWIRSGVVVHDRPDSADSLLAEFAHTLTGRGFHVHGFVERHDRRMVGQGLGRIERSELLDLASGNTIPFANGPRITVDGHAGAAESCLRAGLRDDADLVVISRFPAFASASRRLMTTVESRSAHGLPVLTSIAGRCLDEWYRFAGHRGSLLSPHPASLWQWWGAERLYRDLALGVADARVHRIICGPRWLMIQGATGVGLAPLPKSGAPLLARLPALRQMTLRALAGFTQSWDALEMAVGIAAINAHYNRFDLDVAYGNGAQALRDVQGRVTVIGAFPGLAEILPGSQVIEAQPRPGELPPVAMDTVLPGCAAVVVSATSIVNRTLPRILRLTYGSRVALIGPATPLTPRLHSYGPEILGGLRVRDPDGLAEAVAAGGLPRDFDHFGDFVHIRAPAQPGLAGLQAVPGQLISIAGRASEGQPGTDRPLARRARRAG